MEENLWKFQQQTRKLKEQRADTQVVWDDSASRDLAMRYLNPHQDENELMERGLKRQLAHIKATKQHLTQASEHAHLADIYAKQMQENLDFFSQESEIAHAHYNTFSKYNAVALNTFPKIQTLIYQANRVC